MFYGKPGPDTVLGRARPEQHVLSKAYPQGNKKPTEDQPEARTEHSVPFQNPGSRSCSAAVKKAIADVGSEEKGEHTNDDKDQLEQEVHSSPFTEQPGKADQEPRQERKQDDEVGSGC